MSLLSLISGIEYESRKLKGGMESLFHPVLTLWSGCHIDGHVWRLVIVPLDLVQSFRICAHYRYHVIHRVNNHYARVIKSSRERQLTFAWRAKLRKTIQ